MTNMTSKSKIRIIVIGAGYAGLLATVRLAGKTRRDHVDITLINASDVFVERLRLHQVAAGQPVPNRPISATLNGTGVRFVHGTVEQIALGLRSVSVRTAAGQQELEYDYLLYALGSTIERDRVAGVREHAYVLTGDGPHSAKALREALPTVAAVGGMLTVCGGGATGIEAAAEFAKTFPKLRVRLMTRGEFGTFKGAQIAAHMHQSLAQLGVTVQDHTEISEVQANAVITSSGQPIAHDLCLWTGGFAVSPLAAKAGLVVNPLGQILIDPHMRSVSHPEVLAVGDAAQQVEEPGVPVRMSAFVAAVTGAHGADCLAALVQGRTPAPLSFAYAGQAIALGPKNAIGFNTYPADKANQPFFTGRVGFELREFFVRFLTDLPNLERRMPGFFLWVGKGRYAAARRRASRKLQANTSR